MESHKIHVPNHQPDFIVDQIYLYLLGVLNPHTSLGGHQLATRPQHTSANFNHAIPPDRSIQQTQSQRHCIGPDLSKRWRVGGELGETGASACLNESVDIKSRWGFRTMTGM